MPFLENIIYSGTSQIRPPVGLAESGLNSEVVLILKYGLDQEGPWRYQHLPLSSQLQSECPLLSLVTGRNCEAESNLGLK